MDDSKLVAAFFDKKAESFDAYYSEKKNIFWKTMDWIFRDSMRRRFDETLKEFQKKPYQKVLDVGCGSGRYTVALAESGARVLGIDFSSRMIKLAESLAQGKNLQNQCRFVLGDFKDIPFIEHFDVTIAIGFFDYLKDPKECFEKMLDITSGKMIASFPAQGRWQNIIRWIRLKLLRCPVYFYDEEKIRHLLKNPQIKIFTIQNLNRDYFVVIEPF